MRQGERIYGADTHCVSSAKLLQEFLSPRLRELVPDLESFRREVRVAVSGERLDPPFRHRYRLREPSTGWAAAKPCVLGEAEPREHELLAQRFTSPRCRVGMPMTRRPSGSGIWTTRALMST